MNILRPFSEDFIIRFYTNSWYPLLKPFRDKDHMPKVGIYMCGLNKLGILVSI